MRATSIKHIDPTPETSSYPNFMSYTETHFRNRSPFLYENGTYFFNRALGKGGYGEIGLFKSKSEKFFVVKAELPNQSKKENRFEEGKNFEIEAKINHILHGVGVLAGNPDDMNQQHFILLNYLKGNTLYDWMIQFAKSLKEQSHDQKLLLRIWILIAAATHQLHEVGYLHGDLHPRNIILDPKMSSVFLIDFGLSSGLGALHPHSNFAIKNRLKSPHLPSEFFRGEDAPFIQAHPSQDVFSLGYHLGNFLGLLFSQQPQITITTQKALYELRNTLTTERASQRYTIPDAICKVITLCFSCLPKSPANYYDWLRIIFKLLETRLRQASRLEAAETETAILDKFLTHFPKPNLIHPSIQEQSLLFVRLINECKEPLPVLFLMKRVTAAFFLPKKTPISDSEKSNFSLKSK